MHCTASTSAAELLKQGISSGSIRREVSSTRSMRNHRKENMTARDVLGGAGAVRRDKTTSDLH
jgi:hypothetical protein